MSMWLESAPAHWGGIPEGSGSQENNFLYLLSHPPPLIFLPNSVTQVLGSAMAFGSRLSPGHRTPSTLVHPGAAPNPGPAASGTGFLEKTRLCQGERVLEPKLWRGDPGATQNRLCPRRAGLGPRNAKRHRCLLLEAISVSTLGVPWWA